MANTSGPGFRTPWPEHPGLRRRRGHRSNGRRCTHFSGPETKPASLTGGFCHPKGHHPSASCEAEPCLTQPVRNQGRTSPRASPHPFLPPRTAGRTHQRALSEEVPRGDRSRRAQRHGQAVQLRMGTEPAAETEGKGQRVLQPEAERDGNSGARGHPELPQPALWWGSPRRHPSWSRAGARGGERGPGSPKREPSRP